MRYTNYVLLAPKQPPNHKSQTTDEPCFSSQNAVAGLPLYRPDRGFILIQAGAAALVSLACLSLGTICSAQDRPIPTPTPTISPTATPAVTATPAKSSQPSGTPFSYVARQSSDPQGSPAPTPIRQQDQPPPGDPQYGTTLKWVTYTPPTNGPDGTSRWPVIVLLHIGGYKSGNFYQSFGHAPQDLAAAGFYVVVADYPLAPPNNITGQYAIQQADPTHSGRYPQQTRAVEAVIDAAKNDIHCYHGLVGVLGGSAGASHAAYIALDVTDTGSAWPFWKASARPKCIVGLSGQYDFSDRSQDVLDEGNFVPNIENYTYTTVPLQQWQYSPNRSCEYFGVEWKCVPTDVLPARDRRPRFSQIELGLLLVYDEASWRYFANLSDVGSS